MTTPTAVSIESTTATLIAQLRTVLDLTHTEIQVAETRIAQARTDAVRRELTQNAEHGRTRANGCEDTDANQRLHRHVKRVDARRGW